MKTTFEEHSNFIIVSFQSKVNMNTVTDALFDLGIEARRKNINPEKVSLKGLNLGRLYMGDRNGKQIIRDYLCEVMDLPNDDQVHETTEVYADWFSKRFVTGE